MTETVESQNSFMLVTMILPWPSRKRVPAHYHFRVNYRNPTPDEPGCVATWEVVGGRDAYQVALERTENHDHIWHCTCPDSVYRHAGACKHVDALIDHYETIGNPLRPTASKAA